MIFFIINLLFIFIGNLNIKSPTAYCAEFPEEVKPLLISFLFIYIVSSTIKFTLTIWNEWPWFCLGLFSLHKGVLRIP